MGFVWVFMGFLDLVDTCGVGFSEKMIMFRS
ncbi:hypothetical protein JOD21_003752 [Jeotgalibacillus terrae]|nr:hypothetical protein [Jeotgalibacillus terrae]